MKKLCTALIAAVLFLVLSLDCSAEPVWNELEQTGAMALQYATEFSVDYYGDYSLIRVTDGRRYLVVPEDVPVPEQLDEDITVLQQPFHNVYMIATSAMDLYRAIGAIPRVHFSCQQESGWYIPEAAEAMQSGAMVYAGKYSAPDYELLCSQGCDLAVHSTMAYHTPEVQEMLELLGIPVFIERSSRETHPLGRMEWMKVHALILGCLEEAEHCYDAELERLQPVMNQIPTGKTVAFFAVNDDGTVTVRKSEDYLAKTIDLAGGIYIFDDLGGDSDAQTTLTMTMESFFSAALDADILICSSTMVGELQDLADLTARSELLRDFLAFQNGDVWCTRQSLFQSTMGLGEFIQEVNGILTGNAPEEMQYLYRLQ